MTDVDTDDEDALDLDVQCVDGNVDRVPTVEPAIALHEEASARHEASEEDDGDDGGSRRGRRATQRRGMRAGGHAITSPPPPNTLHSPVPTHSHSWLVVDAIKLS